LTATFWLYPARALHAADGMALFWSWYNIILLTLACFSCIELGQRRKGDRFAAHENVRLHYNGRSAEWFMLDISVSGVRFSGAHSFEIGQEVEIELGKRMLKAKIARLTPDGFALAFAPTLEARVAAIQFVFSGRFSSEDAPIAPKALAKALIARVFH
jgi:cellulose synthase (UDP-forming)